jgi:hypothetical protein
MSFTPGHPKYGGRRKGTTNKVALSTLVQLQAYLDQEGVNPFVVLVDLMRTTSDEKIKLLCASTLADRLLPKLKAVEVSGNPDKPLLVLTPEQRQARIALLHAKLNGHQS